MDQLLQSVKIDIDKNLYIKNPESSSLGKRIVEESISMINDIGFESFNFKKLGLQLNSNESSIYRYFENKHKLLLYLTSWYWGWVEYKLVFATHNVQNASEKLKKALAVVTRPIKIDSDFSHIHEELLSKIVINEYSKSYSTKEVDAENKEGYFVIYKRLVTRLSVMVKEVDSNYAYPNSLASTVLEGSLHQHFLKDHFVSLTDCRENSDLTNYFSQLVFNSLNVQTNG
ncbi:TetR family transcriptional regulator [Flavobacteriaceae bacterium MAR_2009_75]|nr:TetR family transcriptional regulator [Flavobacteriaceae bacterium MAR_2009_75]